MTSRALWVALLWTVLIGTRSVSAWFGMGTQMETVEAYLEGSALDRNIALILIITGFLVLLLRRPNWRTIFASNVWFFTFFLYCGISIIWSDYPFVAWKRWIKDTGNIVMVLIVLTENDPVRAVKAVLARYVYLVIPLSVLFVKYFPELGRYYNRWTWEVVYCGITTNKNELGVALFVSGLFLAWDFIDTQTAKPSSGNKADLLGRLILGLMILWLQNQARSATAFACLVLGVFLLLFTRLPSVRKQVKHLGAYSLVIGLMVLLLYSIPGILEAFTGMLGRNPTLTGRTDLWAVLLRASTDPVLGTGYKSFWLGSTAAHVWEQFSFHPIQAHNGYLETYLNGGLVGLGLLLGMIISGGGKLKQQVEAGSSFAVFRLSSMMVALFYNWTEALFDQFSLVWIILLVAVLNYSSSYPYTSQNVAPVINGNSSALPTD
jgi:exopolysaccharide production protein ExoQ